MGLEYKHRAILNRKSILFLGCIFMLGHFASRAGNLQSFQASLDGNPSLETSEIHQEVPPKSSIEISDPDANTIWTVSEPAQLQWETENIGAAKSIRFFLAKDDMVVQELGSFKNDSFAEGIELAKNVGSGDRYQVVGIELFPDNKFQVAKYVSPYFLIRNPEADARKAVALAKREKREESQGNGKARKNPRKAKKGKTKKTRRKTKVQKDSNSEENRDLAKTAAKKKPSTPKVPDASITNDATNEFQGRKISYIKELSFTKEEVSVSLWDHGRQDGDIVSIYLNGETVVSKHLLTYHRKKVSFKLDASKTNELFLYAHNLGEAPPNTVSIELTDGSTSEKIILNSDLKSCEAVQIKVQ